MPSDRTEGDPVEHFLVDGVAPAVIGGGPPESPFDMEPDPEPPRPNNGPPNRAANYGRPPTYGQPAQPAPGQPAPRPHAPGHLAPAQPQTEPPSHAYSQPIPGRHLADAQPANQTHLPNDGRFAPGRRADEPYAEATSLANYGQPAPGHRAVEQPYPEAANLVDYGHPAPGHHGSDLPYAEPPTSPIPALGPPTADQPEKRKSLFSRMFRLPGE